MENKEVNGPKISAHQCKRGLRDRETRRERKRIISLERLRQSKVNVLDGPLVRVKHEVSKQIHAPGSEHEVMRHNARHITAGVFNVLEISEHQFLQFLCPHAMFIYEAGKRNSSDLSHYGYATCLL
jgi:hypothetical protein